MMNRTRLMVLAVVAVGGGLGLANTSVRAQSPSIAAPAPAPAARYYYGPGYYGYGYYNYPNAPAAPTYRGSYFIGPARAYGSRTPASRPSPDYTGRHDGLARPWLRPLL